MSLVLQPLPPPLGISPSNPGQVPVIPTTPPSKESQRRPSISFTSQPVHHWGIQGSAASEEEMGAWFPHPASPLQMC